MYKLQYTTHFGVNQEPLTSRCELLANTGGSERAVPEAAFRTAARLFCSLLMKRYYWLTAKSGLVTTGQGTEQESIWKALSGQLKNTDGAVHMLVFGVQLHPFTKA